MKTFTVDTSDEAALTRLISQLRLSLHQAKVANGHQTRRQYEMAQLDARTAIINSDIPKIYENMKLDTSPVYYVYAHLDPTKQISPGRFGRGTFSCILGMTHQPFYIGKGTGGRFSSLRRNETHKKRTDFIKSLGLEPKVHIIKENLTEVEALMLESKLIDIYGLMANGGALSNLDEGVNKLERRAIYFQHLAVLSKFNTARSPKRPNRIDSA